MYWEHAVKVKFAGAMVKGCKSKIYYRSMIATLQPVFHITCNLAKLSLQSSIHVLIV
jgi:hypothetical protein